MGFTPYSTLKKLLAKLRELNNLDQLTARVDKTMKGLHDKRINLLREIEEKFVHYNNLKNLQQEESEERTLLKALERVVLREKRYIEFLRKILARFDKDLGEMRESIAGRYYMPSSAAGYGSDALGYESQRPDVQFCRSIENLLFHNLQGILFFTSQRISQELSFINKWVGGTGPLSFFRQKSVLSNFKKKLEGLHAIYKENEEYARSQLQKIPAMQKDIQTATTNWLAYIRRRRIGEKNTEKIYEERIRQGYSDAVSSLGKESSNLGGWMALGIATGLGVGWGVAMGRAAERH